ncbi:hypothetical protein B0I32_103246 [Nonomuraea fuscirosea]|uniref:Uncharacterized protein n=1 Tax=Nonomuraea fuscirosea TaxID=1291556 RepID=A0A2T0N6Z0_9ACTN|nr:hypothetical protein [Nonomuraea fuscirosea]PRX68285.1 hypothetical protein B0I32_103246 [Nonomuraea fuscirosea]
MSTPSNQPPQLVVPGQNTPPAGTQQLHIADRSGNVARTVQVTPAGARPDPGFHRRLISQLNVARQPTRQAMLLSGLGVAALALDVAATLNVGNPFLFSSRRDTWKEMSGSLEGDRSNLWRGYFDDIAPNWKGDAAEILQQYVRFNVNGLFSQLGKVSDDMSGAMQTQFKEVAEYDLSVLGLYAGSAPVFKALAGMSAHPVGRAALLSYLGIWAGALGNLLKQFADIYVTNEGELNKLELRLNDLLGAFYNSGKPEQGPRELNISPQIQHQDRWVPMEEQS